MDKSAAYYHSIASSLSLPAGAFVDGSFVNTQHGEKIETINPATGEVLTTISCCETTDVNLAVASGKRAFREGGWSRSAPEVRKAALLKFAEIIRHNLTELAVLESLDSGKPIKDCLNEVGVEVPHTFQWYAELIDKSFGKVAPTGESACAMITREPIGVVGAVLPWNFPLLMASWKLAPALASGCSVVVKPAEQTSLSMLRLAELAVEAGIPHGVLNVVPGRGEITGRALGLHDDIDAISFTGSSEVGRMFLQYAANSNIKSVGLELGGKSPFLVLDDAVLSPRLIDNAVMSAFWNGGQNCSANMRQIIHRNRQEEFLHLVRERTQRLVIGDPLDPATDIGPLISEEHRRRVQGCIDLGSSEGARPILGFDNSLVKQAGTFLAPTIFADLTPDMTIAREEIFGPVLGVLPVDDDQQALALANASDYGLHATIYTQDIDKALMMARRMECGTVAVNGFTEGDIKTPFGGYKRSGSLARDKGTEAMEQYMQTKTTWINLSP